MNDLALATSARLAAELATNAPRLKDTRDVELRFGHLKQMGRSAQHCRYSMQFESDDSIAKRLGSAVHSLLLGGAPLRCYPGKQRRGEKFEEFKKQQPPNAIILLAKDYDRAHRINEAVRSNHHAEQVLFAPGSIYEETIHWTWLGRSRRCTPDVRSASHLVELKSTRNASPDKFKWDVLRFAYHAQLADYDNALKETRGYGSKDVYIVAVEQQPPHTVATYKLNPNHIDQGMRLVRLWMERFLACEAANVWPGYCESITELDLPSPDGDFELEFGDDEDGAEGDAE